MVREARSGYDEEEDVTEVFTSSSKPRARGHHRGRGKVHRTTTEEPEHHVVTESTFRKIEHVADDMLHTASEKSHIPFWAILLILLVIVLVIIAAIYFCLAKYWRKFRESDKGAKFKGLDLKSVNLIGQLGKEKVSP